MGSGKKLAIKLKNIGIYTGLQLRNANPKQIRNLLTVGVEKIIYKLKGVSCLSLEKDSSLSKSVQVTRSFGAPLSTLEEIKEAVALYVLKVAEKFKRLNMETSEIFIFIRTDRFKKNYYISKKLFISLPPPTNLSLPLLQSCLKGVEKVFEPFHDYKKAGVVF